MTKLAIREADTGMELEAELERYINQGRRESDVPSAEEQGAQQQGDLKDVHLTFYEKLVGKEGATQIGAMEPDKRSRVALGVCSLLKQVQENRPGKPDVMERQNSDLAQFLLDGADYRQIAEQGGRSWTSVYAGIGNAAQRLARNLDDDSMLTLLKNPEQVRFMPPQPRSGKVSQPDTGSQSAHGNSNHAKTELVVNPDNEFRAPSMQRMFDHTLLTPAQEIDYAKRIERGDLVAKDALIEGNIRLIKPISFKYRNVVPSFTEADLIQEGALGLVRAAEKFDWRKGFRFSTYATLWIRQAMQRGIQDKGYMIRMPVHWHNKNSKLGRTEREMKLQADNSMEAVEELSRLTGIPVKDILQIKRFSAHTMSLDKPLGPETDATFGEILDSGVDVAEEAEDNQFGQMLEDLVGSLEDKSADIIRMKFGLYPYTREMPLSRIAKKHNISKETVRNRVERSLATLRERMQEPREPVF